MKAKSWPRPTLIATDKRGKHLVARINKKTLGAVKQLLAEIEGG